MAPACEDVQLLGLGSKGVLRGPADFGGLGMRGLGFIGFRDQGFRG